MAKVKKIKHNYKKPGLLVSWAHAGVKFPGRKAVKAGWNAKMNRIKAGGRG